MASLLRGDFGEAWLQAVAAGSGILHGRPSTVDLDKADVQLSLPTVLSGDDERTVKVQVKTALDFTAEPDGTAAFELDVPTYDVLRVVMHTVRRVLAVIWLERDGDRIRLQGDGTLLVGRSAWVSLEDKDATSNTSSVTIRVPLANTIDQPGLLRMLELYGVPRSSQVPDVDWWTGA
jgi:Domain of unknown function (DUF4365)